MSESMDPISRSALDRLLLQEMSFRFDDQGAFVGLEAYVSFGNESGGVFVERETIPLQFSKAQVQANLSQAERDALVSIRNKLITAGKARL